MREAVLNLINTNGETIFSYPLVGNGFAANLTLTSSSTTGGTVTLSGNQLWGGTATATATPNTGYAFTGWLEDGVTVSSSSSYSFTVTSSRSLLAMFSSTPAVITATPLSGNFGATTTGTTSPERTFTITNSGLQTLSIASLYLTGINRAEFGVTSNCGQSLSPGASCLIWTNFNPASAGTKTARLNIAPLDPATPVYVIDLSGYGGTPVMLYSGGFSADYFSSAQSAYNSAFSGTEIRLWAADFNESLNCNRQVTTTIRGGYNGNFADRIGKSVLKGTLTISSGTLIIDGLQLGGSSSQSSLSVTKNGVGTGVVTSQSGEIDCGSSCTATINNTGSIVLNATADGCSSFTGWSGSNCSGTGSCIVDMGLDASVAATFGKVPPTVSFTASPAPQVAPNSVKFTDTSQCAESQQWDFGDGTTSTEENPTHTYQGAGSYTVTLLVGNAGGNSVSTSRKVLSYIDLMPILMMFLLAD